MSSSKDIRSFFQVLQPNEKRGRPRKAASNAGRRPRNPTPQPQSASADSSIPNAASSTSSAESTAPPVKAKYTRANYGSGESKKKLDGAIDEFLALGPNPVISRNDFAKRNDIPTATFKKHLKRTTPSQLSLVMLMAKARVKSCLRGSSTVWVKFIRLAISQTRLRGSKGY